MLLRNYGQADARLSLTTKLIALLGLFALIFVCIFLIRSFPKRRASLWTMLPGR